jgi:hypothetical protein
MPPCGLQLACSPVAVGDSGVGAGLFVEVAAVGSDGEGGGVLAAGLVVGPCGPQAFPEAVERACLAVPVADLRGYGCRTVARK